MSLFSTVFWHVCIVEWHLFGGGIWQLRNCQTNSVVKAGFITLARAKQKFSDKSSSKSHYVGKC